jgi:hypothetical protein
MELLLVIFMLKVESSYLQNVDSSVETDTQRLGATRRTSKLTPRGAKPWRAAHLQH